MTAALVALYACAPRPATAATSPEAAAVRAWRIGHEAEVLREFADLLAIPDVASDSVNIHRNAAALVSMLERRGIHARTLVDATKVLDAIKDPLTGYYDPRDPFTALPKAASLPYQGVSVRNAPPWIGIVYS